MKNRKFLIYFLLLINLLVFRTAVSQTFWMETFGIGCSQGSQLSMLPNPGGNGSWATTYLGGYVPIVSSGSDEFFVSATESQTVTGSCSGSCMTPPFTTTNRCLHIANLGGGSNTPLCPSGDCGAMYNAKIFSNLRAESPVISTAGKNNVFLGFDYLEYGDGSNDNGTVVYRIGNGIWLPLVNTTKTNCGNSTCTFTACSGFAQGIWTSLTVSLPATTWNQPGIQIGFEWINNGDTVGTDPSFAIDNVTLFTSTGTFIEKNSQATNGFEVFPNPVKDVLHLKLNQELLNATIEMLDLLGNTMNTKTFSGSDFSINISEYPSGIYFVKIIHGGSQEILKVIKE